MAEKQNQLFAETQAKHSKKYVTKQEELHLQEMLTMSKVKVDSIFQRVSDLPAKLVAENDAMIEAKKMMEHLKQSKAEKLNVMKKKNKETARKQASILNAHERIYKRKVIELDAIEQECECLENVLKQKRATLADLQKESQAEMALYARQRSTLNNLRSRYGLEGDKSNVVLHSDPSKMDEIFIAKQAEIENLLKENSAIAKALAAAESVKTLKTIELAAQQFRAAANKEMCAHEEASQLENMSEYRTTEERRKAEISELEQQLAGQRAAYENVQKINADLSHRITSEFGNAKSVEEMINFWYFYPFATVEKIKYCNFKD